MSKVLEKIVDSQVRNYLNYRDILYSKQFGFRGLRGTVVTKLCFCSPTLQNLKKFQNMKVLTAFLDLRI